MVVYRFKERDYAKRIMEGGFQTRYMLYELKILAKYYKELGYKPKKREELIYKFCEEHIKNFNKVKYFRKIKTVLNYATNKKNKTLQIDKINITKSELNYINGLKISNLHKKVVFCLLVENKLSRQVSKIINNGTGYEGVVFGGNRRGVYKDLCEVAEVKSYTRINEIINELKNKEVVNIIGRGKISLDFINNIEKCEDVALCVTNFENTGLYYDKHVGDKKVLRCELCRNLIRQKSNRTKYCDECLRRKQLIWDKEYQKKKYNSRVLEKTL